MKHIFFTKTLSELKKHPDKLSKLISQRYGLRCMKSIYSFKHPKHYLFKYEELVNNPVATLTKLFNFIGVPFEDSILLNYDKHSNARDFTSEKLLPYKPIEKIQNTWVERWKDPIHEEIVASFKNKRKRCIGFEIPDIQ